MAARLSLQVVLQNDNGRWMTTGRCALRRCGRVAVSRLLFAVIALAMITTRTMHAQTVRGVVSRTGVPIPGVVVQLLDSTRAVVIRALSDERGVYRLLAPRSGTYQLSARRIGYAPVTSPAFVLAVDETREVPLSLTSLAISLDTVKVKAKSSCEKMNAVDASAILIWEQARTAIMATQMTLDRGAMSATLLNYHRTRAPDGTSTLQSLTLTELDSVSQLWTSPSAGELARSGYIVQSRDSTNFRAPALNVMASDEFAALYCYRVEESADSTGVTVSFEPAKPKKDIAELRGQLTLDKQTAALRTFDFQYTNIAKMLTDAGAGGRMEFVPLRDGGWAISRWVIRMPFLKRDLENLGAARRVKETIGNIDTGGGDLLVARRGNDTLFARVIPPVNGIVYDSASGATIAGARLRLRETDREARTDSVGHFTFARVMPGEYTMLVNTPSLDSIGALTAVPLLVSDSLATVSVRVANARRVLPAVCRTPADSIAFAASNAILRGTVRFLPDSALPSGIAVLAQWKDSTNAVRVLRGRADDLGRYRVCGVPMGTSIDVRAEAEALSSAVTRVTVDSAAPYGQVDLMLERPRATEAVVTGLVTDSLNMPLEGVAIELPTLGLKTATDSRGEFRLPSVPSGTQLLTVRRLGFAPVDKTLKLAAGDVVRQTYVLTKVQTVAAVKTTANASWMRDFEEHKKLGLGQFLTRDQLEKKEFVRLGTVLSELRGTQIVSDSKGRQYIKSNRLGCYAQIYLDKTPVYLRRNGEPLQDLNEFHVADVESIEWFASASETPPEYSNLNSNCGVLVLHTRQE